MNLTILDKEIGVKLKPSELLSDESKWCQNHYALDQFGRIADPNHPAAVRWCARGAARKCGMRFPDEDFPWLDFNDTHTFDEVRAKLIEIGL